MISQTHKLDVVPGGVTAVVHVKQYQTGESLVFELFSRFGDFEISAQFTECTVRGTKSDGNGYSANATCDPSNNSVTVQLTEQMTAVAGRQPYEITITESTGRMITTTFILDVHRAALDADTMESESVIREVQTVVEEYLEDHPGLFVVDPTLTQSGEAADAKVTGDEIADLKSAIGDLDDLTTETKTDLVSAINEAATSGGSALTDTQKELIITIMRNALYTSNQSANIDALEETFANTVVSISATLNLNGNTIYSDDTLDVLRQYLVVRATYDDGTKQTVTGYALSGTLTVGTSIVQVLYRDCTASVYVPVSQAVTRYTITNNLTGVTNSNTSESIPEGNTYTGVLTATTTGYVPLNVAVSVGGTDVTASAYNEETYTITINNVQGNIVISATEGVQPPTPSYRGRNLVFDGTANTVIDTGLTLCDSDKDVTIIVEIDTPVSSSITSTPGQIVNCGAGSTDKDGYIIGRNSTDSTPMYAFGVGAGISFHDTFNALDDKTQVITMRHAANSGTVETSAKVYKNGTISKDTKTANITFAAHNNPCIIGARRWNGINGIITGTVKLVEIYEQYLTDDQINVYYE